MSGHKKSLHPSQPEELSGLSQSIRRLDQVEKDYREVKDRLEQTRLGDFRLSYDQLQNQQAFLNQTLNSLTDRLQNYEDETNQTFYLETTILYEQLLNSTDEVWGNLSSLIDHQGVDLQFTLENSLATQEEHLNCLYDTIRQLSDGEEERYFIARESLYYAIAYFNSFQKSYPQIHIFDEELEDICQQLDQADQNLEAGFYEAVLMTSQEVTHRLSSFLIESEAFLYQRNIELTAVHNKALVLQEMIRKNYQVRAINLEGIELDVMIDVDFWSYGLWNKTNRSCHNLQNHLLKSGDGLDLPKIKSIQDRLGQIEENLYIAVRQARQNVISSQIRYNMAECVVDALYQQGYGLDSSGYRGDDMRGNYQAVLRHIDCSQVTICLSQVEGEACTQTLTLDLDPPEGRSEHELRQQAKEISQALQAYGLQVEADNHKANLIELPLPSPFSGRPQIYHSHGILQHSEGSDKTLSPLEPG